MKKRKYKGKRKEPNHDKNIKMKTIKNYFFACRFHFKTSKFYYHIFLLFFFLSTNKKELLSSYNIVQGGKIEKGSFFDLMFENDKTHFLCLRITRKKNYMLLKMKQLEKILFLLFLP
jgi:hypothetical protein